MSNRRLSGAKPFTHGATCLPNLIQALYKFPLQPLLFCLDAESAHTLVVHSLSKLGKSHLMLQLMRSQCVVNDSRLNVEIRSLSCPNPVGMAAGFDKNAELLNVLPSLGFGFIEVGTFTPLKQAGQTRPRMFRYPKAEALVNRMGFNNPGIKAAAERLKARSKVNRSVPVGANIGKGRETPLEEAIEDYMSALEQVLACSDYIVVNISSPNTPNLRKLQKSQAMRDIMKRVIDRVRQVGQTRGEAPKLVFSKISPDCTEEELLEIAHLSVELGFGIIATNTTIDHSSLNGLRKKEDGGLSGAPLREKSDRVIQKIFQATRGVVPIIGVGGVFSAEDAYRKIRLGASLVQIYTGMIYRGPGLVRDINQGLLRFIERDGFKRIQDAVGTLN